MHEAAALCAETKRRPLRRPDCYDSDQPQRPANSRASPTPRASEQAAATMAAAKQRPEQQPATCDPTVAVRTAAAPNLAAEADHNTDGPRARGGAPLWWSLERPRQLLGALARRRRVISTPTLTTAPHAALSGVTCQHGVETHARGPCGPFSRTDTRISFDPADSDENSFSPPFPPLHVDGILEPFPPIHRLAPGGNSRSVQYRVH